MKKLIIVGVVLILALFATISFSSETSITGNAISASVSETGTKLTGNVVITLEKGKEMVVNSDKVIKRENELLLEGNVEIKFDNSIIHTEKATILTINDTVKIKMDSCEIVYI